MQTYKHNRLPFLETIRVVDGIIEHSDYHIERMRQTCLFHYHEFGFEKILDNLRVPENGILKLNIWYNQYEKEIKISEYVPASIKKIEILECDPDFNYSFKYSDRSYLNSLLKSTCGADEIIISKNGFITDTSKANIVFEKSGKYYTPDTFLLNGTMRQHLIRKGRIIQKAIKAKDIFSYENLYFINALNPLEMTPAISCKTL
ncbi:MAG: aminotransferase class IV [Bacteroidales bacterium]|jgi:4-amino-4-deoxychorismate lyase|nr:aminotransferase class IV [Bacteroidales bacterium]